MDSPSEFGLESYDDPIAAARQLFGARRTKSRSLSISEDNYFTRPRDVVHRRRSYEKMSLSPRQFMVTVASTKKALLLREDTDGDGKITESDTGPQNFSLGTLNSDGFNRLAISGTYSLSNLLYELTLAEEKGMSHIILDDMHLNEGPVVRLDRLIKTSFWKSLTRRMDASVIEIAAVDPKDWTDDPRPRIYVPAGAPKQLAYYRKVAEERPQIRLDVQEIPEGEWSPDYYRELMKKPGILALEMEESAPDPKTGETTLTGLPFIVPGGRFNELYGWDSYFIAVGLLASGETELAKSMVLNFCFEIRHYGKILNANRSYYLFRSQPPFLTDMALKTYEAIKHEPSAKDFLKRATLAAIKEYNGVWHTAPRYDAATGLSRFRPDGNGIPRETEPFHFAHLLNPYAEKLGMTYEEFVDAYDEGKINEPELDEYLLHDRAVRESGHDTSYRLEGWAADLATIDLNALLYKYEIDLAKIIRTVFHDNFHVPVEYCVAGQEAHHESSALWERRAKLRKQRIDKYLWNEEKGQYFDYNTKTKEQSPYDTVTTFYALWSGVASPHQAHLLVSNVLSKFEYPGGLVSTSKMSLATDSKHLDRQWDYPYGWAPHQFLAWDGLEKYGYWEEEARLAYRWLHMITKVFMGYNGAVVEKYNVTHLVAPHKVYAEYGNQGDQFIGAAKEGFGWVNASYVYGLNKIDSSMKKALGVGVPYETYVQALAMGVGRIAKEYRY